MGGNTARIGTSLKEGLAPVVIGGFALNLGLNIILLLQIVIYWKATAASAKKGSAPQGKAAGKGTPAGKGKQTPNKKKD